MASGKKEALTEDKELQKKIKKSLSYSIAEGSFWSVMIGAGEKYLSAFAVFLKATNTQIGLLTSLPTLFSSFGQLLTPKLIEIFKTRKKFIVASIFIQALSWLLILSVFFLGKFKVYYLILFAVIYWIAGSISSPAWSSMMGDLVSPEQKGKYFAKRTKIIVLIIFIVTALAGLLLDLFKNGPERQYLGFAAIFLTAMLARLASTFCLSRQYEPEMTRAKKAEQFSFIEFIKEAPHRNFGLFVIFMGLMSFGVYISAPFFVAFMLYDLKLSYTQFMILLSASLITKYLSYPAWGKLSDKYGNKKILTFTGYLVPFIPILWMFSTNFYYLILVELFSGIAWAGLDLSTFNFVFDTTTPQKRARCFSYYYVFNGVMVFIGTTLGSLIIDHNHLFWTKYYLVFLVSGAVRLLICLLLIHRIKERREVAKISYDQMAVKATGMIVAESFHSFFSIFTYPKYLWNNHHIPKEKIK